MLENIVRFPLNKHVMVQGMTTTTNSCFVSMAARAIQIIREYNVRAVIPSIHLEMVIHRGAFSHTCSASE
jgi:hypothetical protein